MRISDEERREAAEMLRLEADGWHRYRKDDDTFSMSDGAFTESILAAFGFYDTAVPVYELFDKLADLIDPTCHFLPTKQGGYVCDRCYGWSNAMWAKPRCCPKCGARVVDDGN